MPVAGMAQKLDLSSLDEPQDPLETSMLLG